ncbi:unnamed protein product [Rangifer tarandus platyrhynchus]
MGGVGKKESPGDHGHQLPPRRPPRVRAQLPLTWRPTLPLGRPPLPRGFGDSRSAPGQGGVRSAPTPSSTPSASIPPQHPPWYTDPSRPPRTPPQQPATPRPSPSSRSAAPGVCTGEAGNALFPVRFPAQKLVRGGCFLYSPLSLPPQLGSRDGSADSFPLLPGLENLRLRRETASGVKARQPSSSPGRIAATHWSAHPFHLGLSEL